MFLLVPAYPGCPGQTAIKWLLLLLLFSDIRISQGRVATCSRCGRTFKREFVANLLLSLTVKKN